MHYIVGKDCTMTHDNDDDILILFLGKKLKVVLFRVSVLPCYTVAKRADVVKKLSWAYFYASRILITRIKCSGYHV